MGEGEDKDRFRAIIENQALGISEVDEGEMFLFANSAAHGIFGVPQGTLVGRNLREFTDEESFRQVREETEVRKKGESSTYDLAIIRGDGERRIIRVTASPRFDANGRYLSALAIYSDVTELKKAEESLRRRERYFRALLHNAADMVTILDEDFRFRWGSRSTVTVTGHNEAIYGKSILDFIHPDDREGSRADLTFALRNPRTPVHAVRRFRHGDGSYHYHEAIVNNLLDDPDVRGIIINSRDVTERKLMEEQLVARNRELDAFATTVSHDLRTPLSIITGYAQLLQSDDLTDEERKAYVASIARAAQRLDDFTASLLVYAQAGKPEGNMVSLDPGTVIEEVLSERKGDLETSHIEVEVSEELPLIVADRFKLHQVIYNLLDNAIKYTAEAAKPRVEIGAARQGGLVTFYVRDNGCGIDPRFVADIFLPFKRLEGGKSHGLGIGLATVKRAVEAWGGRVWVNSRPGEGSTFFFTAPASDD
ncbi:MAG: PAS domain S-box protein [Actinobacteria bacterium]|nr:PAS domain S-box protein [Actinomycetota bacterium]